MLSCHFSFTTSNNLFIYFIVVFSGIQVLLCHPKQQAGQVESDLKPKKKKKTIIWLINFCNKFSIDSFLEWQC